MIDLTPLDVRKKLGDFGKTLRGYDPQEVDTFLELVAERMEVLVKELLQLRDRGDHLEGRVAEQEGKQKAIQDALVTAQTLREDVKQQADREVDLLRREAQGDADRALELAQSDAQRISDDAQSRADHILNDATQMLAERRAVIEELERRRLKLLKALRSMLERELDEVEIEEGRPPLDMSGLDAAATFDSSITSISGAAPLYEEAPVTEPDSVITPIDEAPSFAEGGPSLDMMEGTTNVVGEDAPDEEAAQELATGVPTLDEILDEAGGEGPSSDAADSPEDDDPSEELEASTDDESKTDSLWLSALRRDRPEADQDT